MRRPVLGFGVIAVLVIAIWAAVASGNDDAPPTTTPAVPSTSTSAVPSTTEAEMTMPSQTSVTTATTVTSTTVDPEARVEEVRLILQDLYYRWFDAIYRNDEEAARGVVALPERLESFHRAADSATHERPPQRGEIKVLNVEILLDQEDCLVVFSTLDISAWLDTDAQSDAVDVLWPHGDGWRKATSWQYKDDLWEGDCTAIRDTELP